MLFISASRLLQLQESKIANITVRKPNIVYVLAYIHQQLCQQLRFPSANGGITKIVGLQTQKGHNVLNRRALGCNTLGREYCMKQQSTYSVLVLDLNAPLRSNCLLNKQFLNHDMAQQLLAKENMDKSWTLQSFTALLSVFLLKQT